MPVVAKFLVTVGLIVASTAAGYLARRRAWVSEHAAQWLMTGVVVFGYSPVSFCSIWSIQPKAYVVPIIMYIVLPTAYFSIGLRLHVSSIALLKRFIAALAGLRFAVCPALGLLLAYVTTLTAHPLTGVGRGVLLINSCVPTAITAVAVANMFRLKPREASVLFVVNTFTYLVVVLPVVFWIFGQ